MSGPRQPTYVYIIGLFRVADCCKIGVSRDPNKRLLSISTGTPFEPAVAFEVLMATSAQARRVELESHKALEAFRANGEWFWVKPVFAYERVVRPLADKINTYREPREYEKVTHRVFPEKRFIIPKTTEECEIASTSIREARENAAVIQT